MKTKKTYPASFTLTVTREHHVTASAARNLDPSDTISTCPLAQAFKAKFPGRFVSVGLSAARIRNKKPVIYEFDKTGQNIVMVFDDSPYVKRPRIKLDLPAKVVCKKKKGLL
jgi:hypothetical protein